MVLQLSRKSAGYRPGICNLDSEMPISTLCCFNDGEAIGVILGIQMC